MLRRMIPHVAPADDWWLPALPGWLGIAFTYQGLKALAVPQSSLDSFPEEFREGMAPRAAILMMSAEMLHPTGNIRSVPPTCMSRWRSTPRTTQSLQIVLERARQCHHDLARISVVYRMKFSELPDGRNPFGFKDGLHNPHVEGSGAALHPGSGPPIKAGEFIMGYPDELGVTATRPDLRCCGAMVPS